MFFLSKCTVEVLNYNEWQETAFKFASLLVQIFTHKCPHDLDLRLEPILLKKGLVFHNWVSRCSFSVWVNIYPLLYLFSLVSNRDNVIEIMSCILTSFQKSALHLHLLPLIHSCVAEATNLGEKWRHPSLVSLSSSSWETLRRSQDREDTYSSSESWVFSKASYLWDMPRSLLQGCVQKAF